MIQSETIGKLAEALAKAQAVIENAKKEASNPFFKSKYADLSSIWDVCRKPLTDNGLSIVQSPVFLTEHPEMVGLDTRLCHASGEWLEGRIVMKPVKSDPQSYGSCLTYLRRYSLQSFISICAEVDDDGNAATGKKPDVKPETTPKRYDDVPEQLGMPEPEKPTEPPKEDESFVKIEKVESKSGETNGKPWKAFFITTATGEKLGTFSETLADLATTYAKEGKLVRLRSKPSKKGREVVSIEDDAA